MGIITGTLFVGLVSYIAKWWKKGKLDFYHELNRSRKLRHEGHVQQAQYIQEQLLLEVENRVKQQQYGMLVEEFFLVRGLIYEELAELAVIQDHKQKAYKYAQQALSEFYKNEKFRITKVARVERLKNILLLTAL